VLGGWRLEALVKYKIQITKSTQATQPKPSKSKLFSGKAGPKRALAAASFSRRFSRNDNVHYLGS